MKILQIFSAAAVLTALLSCSKQAAQPVEDSAEPVVLTAPVHYSKSVTASSQRALELWENVCYTPDNYDIVNFFDFIIESCALGWEDSYVRTTLEKIIAVQGQSGDNLGKLPRYITTNLDYSDQNNVEFGLELSALALIEFYDSWGDDTKALFDDFIDKAIFACWNHNNVAVTYTNIFGMRAWNLIGLGENLDSGRKWGCSHSLTTSQIAQAGYDLLDRLYSQTEQYGFHEFNSPTYTGVQAECIGYLSRYTRNTSRKEKALRLQEYMSALLCSNYYESASVLSGPMSRCYYRGFSAGKIDQLAGGLLMGKEMYAYNQFAAWEIPEKYLKTFRQYPRMVAWTFGDAADTYYTDGKTYSRMNAMNYVDRYYSVSSAGSHYTGNGTEKAVTISVSTENHPCNINFVHYMEGRGDPYGFLPGSSSHTWTCFRDAYARAQRKNEIVWMQAGNCTDNPNATNMCSHVIVPMTNVDEIWVDDKKLLDWKSSPQGTTFFFKIDHVVVTVKYLYTFGVDGSDKAHTLIYDNSLRNYYVPSDGKRHYAMRITTELSKTVPSSTKIAGVAMYWRADDCIYSEKQFGELRQRMLTLDVHTPAQKSYAAGSSSTDTFYCYVNTPEKVKLGINGHFVLKNYYNRYIYDDKNPEYLSSKNWYYNQSAVYGQSIDFSNPCRSFLSVDGWDVGKKIFNQKHL